MKKAYVVTPVLCLICGKPFHSQAIKVDGGYQHQDCSKEKLKVETVK